MIIPLFDPTIQNPESRDSLEHIIVSHRNPRAGNAAEIGSQSLAALSAQIRRKVAFHLFSRFSSRMHPNSLPTVSMMVSIFIVLLKHNLPQPFSLYFSPGLFKCLASFLPIWQILEPIGMLGVCLSVKKDWARLGFPKKCGCRQDVTRFDNRKGRGLHGATRQWK